MRPVVLLHIRQEGGLSACCDHGCREPVRFMGHSVHASMMPGTFSTQALDEAPPSKRARSMLLSVLWLHSLMAFPSGW